MKRLPIFLIAALLLLTAVAMVYYGYKTGYAADFPRDPIAGIAPKFVTLPPINQASAATSHFLSLVLAPAGILLIVITGFFLWLAALVHMLKNPAIQGTEKIVWALVIIFLHILGAIIYFAVAPRARMKMIPLRRRF